MARLIPIDDSADPRVADYMGVRDRDLAGSHGGRFVAEGETVVRVLLTASRYAPLSVLVADNRLALVEALIERHDIPVYVAPQAVMAAIVGFPIHRGLLALASRGAPPAAADLLSARPARVVGLVGLANHDNVGGVFRNAAAFGVGAVLIDPATCDPLYRKAVRVSVGGVLRVPYARVGSAAAMVAMLRAAGYAVIGLSPQGDRRLEAVDRDRPLALLLGAEGPGLPTEVLTETESARIDMAGGFDSLNVATTSGIALYALSAPAIDQSRSGGSDTDTVAPGG